MIELLRLVFPYIFLLYFVVKGIKEPFYFLGIPFLMFMSESIFFEGVKIFKIPGSLTYCLMFLWLVILRIVSIIMQRNEKNDVVFNSRRLNELDVCVIGLIIISFIGFGIAFIKYSVFTDVITEFIILISLFVSYFIIKNWASYNKPELLIKFLYSLVIINSFASLFYILHQGLHINIYNTEEYSSEVFLGKEITRSFSFMPQFLPFSIAFILVFKEKRSFSFFILLIVNLLAVFISYTRSSLINVGFIILLYILFRGIKKGRIGLVLKNVFLYCIIGFLGLIFLSKLLPANTKYFMNRFSELSESSATSGPNNLQFRFMMTDLIVSNMEADTKIIGMGPVTENQISLVRPMQQATADMVWVGVIFRWGFVGLLIFMLLYVFSIIKAFIFFMRYDEEISNLALMFLLFIASQIIESFVSWTFMSGHGFAIGLWYFAFLSALVGFNKNVGLSEEKIILQSE
jgi:hypothetical protein